MDANKDVIIFTPYEFYHTTEDVRRTYYVEDTKPRIIKGNVSMRYSPDHEWKFCGGFYGIERSPDPEYFHLIAYGERSSYGVWDDTQIKFERIKP